MLIRHTIDYSQTITACKDFIKSLSFRISILQLIYFLFIISLIISGCPINGDRNLKFTSMLVEYAENPVNIDVTHPRFSWIVTSEIRNRRQTAYRIIVSSALRNINGNKPDLWDSGRIESGETIQHEYLPENL